jgi:hypothetical protein
LLLLLARDRPTRDNRIVVVNVVFALLDNFILLFQSTVSIQERVESEERVRRKQVVAVDCALLY